MRGRVPPRVCVSRHQATEAEASEGVPDSLTAGDAERSIYEKRSLRAAVQRGRCRERPPRAIAREARGTAAYYA